MYSELNQLQFYQVESSSIRKIAHQDNTLYVRFSSGQKVYSYPNIPYTTFNQLLHASSEGKSVGRLFREIIKNCKQGAVSINNVDRNSHNIMTGIKTGVKSVI